MPVNFVSKTTYLAKRAAASEGEGEKIKKIIAVS